MLTSANGWPASAASNPVRLGVGTDAQILVADSTAATGLKWATAAQAKLVALGLTADDLKALGL